VSQSSPQPSDVRKDVILYVIPGSHACRSAMLMLEHKGIPFRVRTLSATMHPMLVRASGFPGGDAKLRDAEGRRPAMLKLINQLGTVPAMRFGRERVQTNREIARFLDRVRPEPPLFPADPRLRGEVEEAERWADQVLQMAARRITFSAGLEGGLDRLHDRGGSGPLGALLSRSETMRKLVTQIAGRGVFDAAGAEHRLMAALPEMLDRIDAWIAAGVLGGEQLGAADFMIAPSVALLAYRLDLREQIEARPLGAFCERVLAEPALSHG
jgi:glutathione S-transferase